MAGLRVVLRCGGGGWDGFCGFGWVREVGDEAVAGVVGERVHREFAGEPGGAVQITVLGTRGGAVGPAAGGARAYRHGGVAAAAGEFDEERPGAVADGAGEKLGDQQLHRAEDGLGHGPQGELAAQDIPDGSRGPLRGRIGQIPDQRRTEHPAYRRQRPRQLLRGR